MIADLGVLIRMWHGILESFKRATAPALIHKDMNLIYKAARDFITPEVQRVLIDDQAESEKVKDFMRLLGPQYVERISAYDGGRALFSDFKVDEEVQRLMKPKVDLPSGGSIVIESTEALTVIDVNSGKFTGGRNLEDTIVRTNIEAAAEIARQVRLRDIGGIVVCDFIDMSSESSRTKVVETLKNGLQRDRTRTTIQSFSSLGLLEFTRKRIGKDLGAQLRGTCPTCRGLGSVMSAETMAIEGLRGVRNTSHAHRNGSRPAQLEIHAAPTVAASLEFWHEDDVLELERELEAKISVHVDATLHPEQLRIGTPESLRATFAKPETLRVGDELDVEVLSAKLPTPTSALSAVAGRKIDIETGAGAVGRTIRIRILDIADDGAVLAEARTAVPAGTGSNRVAVVAAGADARNRSRPTSRPRSCWSWPRRPRRAPTRARRSASHRPPSLRMASRRVYARHRECCSPGGVSPRRSRRRHSRRKSAKKAAMRNAVVVGAVGADAAPGAVPLSTEETTTAISELSTSGPMAEASVNLPESTMTGGETPAHEGAPRRRRRRRRGRGGTGAAAGAEGSPTLRAVPDRHIFRARTDGSVESTGETAPPEPVRAIAPVEKRRADVAVRGAVRRAFGSSESFQRSPSPPVAVARPPKTSTPRWRPCPRPNRQPPNQRPRSPSREHGARQRRGAYRPHRPPSQRQSVGPRRPAQRPKRRRQRPQRRRRTPPPSSRRRHAARRLRNRLRRRPRAG